MVSCKHALSRPSHFDSENAWAALNWSSLCLINSWQSQAIADDRTPSSSEKAGDAAGYHGVLYGALLVDILCGESCEDGLTREAGVSKWRRCIAKVYGVSPRRWWWKWIFPSEIEVVRRFRNMISKDDRCRFDVPIAEYRHVPLPVLLAWK